MSEPMDREAALSRWAEQLRADRDQRDREQRAAELREAADAMAEDWGPTDFDEDSEAIHNYAVPFLRRRADRIEAVE